MSPFVARIRRDVVVVSGPDAVTWLQGQLSQDVAGLPVGGAAPTFVLSPQGKVAGWGRVARPADDVLRKVKQLRNVVIEIAAVLKAVKPIRPADRALQPTPLT